MSSQPPLNPYESPREELPPTVSKPTDVRLVRRFFAIADFTLSAIAGLTAAVAWSGDDFRLGIGAVVAAVMLPVAAWLAWLGQREWQGK